MANHPMRSHLPAPAIISRSRLMRVKSHLGNPKKEEIGLLTPIPPHPLTRHALQTAEFDALSRLSDRYRSLIYTPIVDDAYPEIRHHYESALKAFLEAYAANGRTLPRNTSETAHSKLNRMRAVIDRQLSEKDLAPGSFILKKLTPDQLADVRTFIDSFDHEPRSD